ncbi:ester cyclase [soil metagenome]
MSEHNRAAARRFFEEAWQGRFEVLDEILAPEAVSHDPRDPFTDLHGPGGAPALMEMYRAAFPDVRFTVEDQVAEGDRAATRWTATGTNDGEIMGMPATGRTSKVTGMTIDRFEDGRIVEGWVNWDTLGMLQQLGLAGTAQAAASS